LLDKTNKNIKLTQTQTNNLDINGLITLIIMIIKRNNNNKKIIWNKRKKQKKRKQWQS